MGESFIIFIKRREIKFQIFDDIKRVNSDSIT